MAWKFVNDDVGGPADGDDELQAGYKHAHARRQADLRHGVLVFDARDEHQQRDCCKHASRDTDRLDPHTWDQVPGFTLLAHALVLTLHPQACIHL